MKPDHERVSKLLLDTVTLLCKNGLTYDQELKVQGLIGITLDNLEVFVVHINESFGTSGAPCVTLSQNSNERETAASTSDSDRQPSRKRHVPSQEDVVDLTRLVETPDIRPARLALPAPPSHSENVRRQRAGPSNQSQQRSQNQTMPSPMSSLADVANRMLPPQGVPAGVPRNDVSGYQIPHAPAMRNNAMVAVSAENLRLASLNAPLLRQRYPNYQHIPSSLREEDSAAVQRQHTQRIAMENKRMAAARMAAAAQQHQLVGQPSVQVAGYPSSYGASGSMQVAQNNYGMMPQRPRNPTMMQSSEQQQQQQQPQAMPSGIVGLPYRFSYHGNPHQYDGQARMFPSASHVPNSVPTMLAERPRYITETSNPVQQLMLDYERLGQQNQTNVLGPAALSTSSAAPFPNASVASNNYATYDMQKQSHRPVQGAPSPRDQAVLHHHIQQEYNLHGSQGKEYFAPSGVPAASPVRRSPRIRVEHIDLSQDIDDEVLQETLLLGLGTESEVPTSSIVIQPDNIDSTADILQSATLFEPSGSSTSQQVRTEANSSQQNQDNLEYNEESTPAYNVQEILPVVDGLNGLDDFDGPNDTTDNSHSRSPDGKLPTGLSDSGRSTGSERMDCTEESLPAQLDGCVDSLPVALGDEWNEKRHQSVPLLCGDRMSPSQQMVREIYLFL